MESSLPADWPAAEHSRFVEAAGIRWHVQLRGQGPTLLLLHGTGASSHSFVPLADELENDFSIIAPDLPGQGFTDYTGTEFASLTGMSRALAALLRALDAAPSLIVGHSAGAAVASSLCLTGACNPAAVIGVNGAMLPFGRAVAPVFSRAAKTLAALPVFPQIVALHAILPKPIERMVRQTGSTIPPSMLHCYRELLGRPRHITGTLRMMANWDLSQLERNLGRLEPPLYLLYGDQDKVVSPAQSRELASYVPGARLLEMVGLGHLAHEESPGRCAEEIRTIASQHLS